MAVSRRRSGNTIVFDERPKGYENKSVYNEVKKKTNKFLIARIENYFQTKRSFSESPGYFFFVNGKYKKPKRGFRSGFNSRYELSVLRLYSFIILISRTK